MEKRFNYFDFVIDLKPDFEDSHVIKEYIGKDKVVYIPDFLCGKPIESIISFTQNEHVKIVILTKSVLNIDEEAFIGTDHVTLYTPHDQATVDFSHVKNVTVRYGYEKSIDFDGILYSLFNDHNAYVYDHNLLERRFERFGRFNEMIEMETIIDDKYTVVGIEQNALYNVINIKNLALPKQLKWIYSKAFYNNEALEYVTLPDTLEEIFCRSFEKCSNLKFLEIPKSVTKIGNHIFDDVYRAMIFLEDSNQDKNWDKDWNSTNLSVYRGFEKYMIQDDIIYALTSDMNAIVVGNQLQTLTDVIIPETIKSNDKEYLVIEIGVASFYEAKYLRSISLSNSIKKINRVAFAYSNLTRISLSNNLESILAGAFIQNIFLEELKLPPKINVISEGLCNGCISLRRVYMGNQVSAIKSDCFRDCYNLSHLNLPVSIETIESYSFYGSGLSHIDLGYKIKEIQDLAFAEMNHLSSLIILNQNCVIGDLIVTSNNVSIYIEGDDVSPLYKKISGYKEVKPRIYCEVIKFQQVDGIKYLLTEYDNAIIYGHIEDEIEEHVNVLDTIAGCRVNRINFNSFFRSKKIKSISIPDSVSYVKENIIFDCLSLEQIDIPSHLADIKLCNREDVKINISAQRDDDEFINEMYLKVEAYVKQKKYINIDEIQRIFELKYATAKEIVNRLRKTKI